MKILLTGGAGYIGSHTCIALRESGFEPVILDNFANSNPLVLDRLERICGKRFALERGNVLDTPWVETVFLRHQPVGVMHFAGDKSVGQSVLQPLKYFNNNIGGAISLLNAMSTVYVDESSSAMPKLIFSSSATVYGNPSVLPIAEDATRSHANPYGHSKLVIEEMLEALCASSALWRVGVLRYFNPVGAHPSGLIGEDPTGLPNNLMPYVAQVAIGKLAHLNVYGSDYATHDGTGVRDYIHVQDLARGHVAALQALLGGAENFTVNLGTGRGYSVLDVVRAFEKACGMQVPYRFSPRRAGDVAECFADVNLAKRLLSWSATQNLADMCADAWRWQRDNPNGYVGSE
jgi:UDP-glucose 4-epimerase